MKENSLLKIDSNGKIIQDTDIIIDSAAINFGGGYPSGGVTIYKDPNNNSFGYVSLRRGIRFTKWQIMNPRCRTK